MGKAQKRSQRARRRSRKTRRRRYLRGGAAQQVLRKVWVLWLGSKEMSAARKSCFETIAPTIGVPTQFITDATLKDIIKPSAPFHPAYEFLSETHKCDYVRAYLMHHYGGGYTDIKRTNSSWVASFDAIDKNPTTWILGHRELSPDTVAGLPPEEHALQERLRNEYSKLLITCAFICRPATPFTTEWMQSVHTVLDKKLELLKQYPPNGPRDRLGDPLPDGSTSKYPLLWTELLGNIFHPLCLKYVDHLQYNLPPPEFSGHV